MREIRCKKVSWYDFNRNNRKDKAVKMAKVMNLIMNGKNVKEISSITQLTTRAIRKYLSQGDFQEKLKQIAPYISIRAISNLIETSEGLQAPTDVRYKANIELLKGFTPLATKQTDHIDFDSSTRRQRLANDGNRELAQYTTVQDMLGVLAKNPYLPQNVIEAEISDKKDKDSK